MSLEIPNGAKCFVDANIVFYHFVSHPKFSAHVDHFFNRAAMGEITAVSILPVIADALHRVMLSEVEMMYGKPKGLSQVQKKPQIISTLRAFPKAVQSAILLPVELIAMEKDLLQNIAGIAASCHLMTNDSLIVASMRRNEIRHLITNDDDFDNVPGLTIWKPR